FQHSSIGNFVLGLSGANGRVRRARQFEIWGTLAARGNIDWKRVHIFLLDERFGFESEEDSNAFLVRDSLVKVLNRRGAGFPESHLVFPDMSRASAADCAAEYQVRLASLLEQENGPHLVTIGLGYDMHISGIFPEWYQADPGRWAAATKKEIGVLVTETSIFEVRL
ncbi:unnamed protein product, partial [Polarella glacialis]